MTFNETIEIRDFIKAAGDVSHIGSRLISLHCQTKYKGSVIKNKPRMTRVCALTDSTFSYIFRTRIAIYEDEMVLR